MHGLASVGLSSSRKKLLTAVKPKSLPPLYQSNIVQQTQELKGWQGVEALLQKRFGKLPDMEATLFLIGINELGRNPETGSFTKEQKEDLIHIAVCTLLSQVGYYRLDHRDEDGWPHFEKLNPIEHMTMPEQESILKACIVHYFGLDE